MTSLNIVKGEDFCKNLLNETVYPITIVKLLLNRTKIKQLMTQEENIELFDRESTICEECATKKDMLCRKHTSIERVIKAKKVVKDTDTGLFIVQNEIFGSLPSGKTLIVYCPHTKLIKGEVTSAKVKKITPFVVDLTIKEENFEKIYPFSSLEMMGKNVQCWFNDQFNLITIPSPSMGYSDFVLSPTK